MLAALAVAVLVLSSSGVARAQTNQTPSRDVRVAVRILEPFVIKNEDGRYSGFSIDLWEEIARTNNYRTTYVEVGSVTEMLDAVKTGEADTAITAISITADRIKEVQFSEPMFNSGLQVAVPATRIHQTGGVWDTLQSPQVLVILAAMLVSILVAAPIVWLIERKDNPDFAHAGPKGMFEGIWWAVVTMLTVGYGDRVTKSIAGRFFSMMFMLFGVLLVASFTATFTATLTVHNLQTDIQGINDLGGHSVATVKGTTSAAYLSSHQIPAQELESVDEMVHKVETGEVDAAVYDAPVLAYSAKQSNGGQIRLAGPPFTREYYGIAEPLNSDLAPAINIALLNTYADGTYNRFYNSWFGNG